jgi:hypothetical protein
MPERVRRGVDSQIYSVVQTQLFPAVLATSVSVPTFLQSGFTLSSLDQVTQLAAVFDQYRIKRIEAWVYPTNDTSAAASQGEMATVLDFDDTTALTTFAQALDYQNCLVGKVQEGHYRSFRPHVAIAAYGSGAFTSYANVVSPWIDCTSTTVAHYGIKYAATVTSSVLTYDLLVRYHVDFRSVR